MASLNLLPLSFPLTFSVNPSENVAHMLKRWYLAILLAQEEHLCWNNSCKSDGSIGHSLNLVWFFTSCGENFHYQDSVPKTGDLRHCSETMVSLRITRNLFKWENHWILEGTTWVFYQGGKESVLPALCSVTKCLSFRDIRTTTTTITHFKRAFTFADDATDKGWISKLYEQLI